MSEVGCHGLTGEDRTAKADCSDIVGLGTGQRHEGWVEELGWGASCIFVRLGPRASTGECGGCIYGTTSQGRARNWAGVTPTARRKIRQR